MEKILAFSSLLHAFQRTDRAIRVPGTERLENDAEHSYLLAMLAWYLIDTLDLKLDKKKVFEYCLAHDIAEAYAGDTPAFGRGGNVSHDNRSTKHEREQEAMKRLRSEFPEFSGLFESAEACEARKDPEAVFVYALDKLLPVIGGYAQKGRDWKRYSLSYEDIFEHKKAKIEASPEVYRIFQELMARIAKNKEDYFDQ